MMNIDENNQQLAFLVKLTLHVFLLSKNAAEALMVHGSPIGYCYMALSENVGYIPNEIAI